MAVSVCLSIQKSRSNKIIILVKLRAELKNFIFNCVCVCLMVMAAPCYFVY